ncbi:hypothetical protein [Nocardia violaceofusca]|uniref:hypothetical protein n=1 Tax=Nocardia violaceofusca TaxID=941182 RepID=UPI0007A3E5E0|nr:hypothetical protein [Nocardia violaceofusca]
MFRVAALIPSPLVLIPELGGATPLTDSTHPAAQVPQLREAVLTAGRMLARQARRWTIVGAGTEPPAGVGSLRGFGADVRVTLSATEPAGEPRPDWPTALLVGAWLRGRIAAEDGDDIEARAQPVDPGAEPSHCVDLGSRLRGELDADPRPHGVLVVADGAATLSTTSPGYLDPRAEREQRRIDDALDAGDRAALGALDPGLCAELEVAGRPGFQVLAGLFGIDTADPKVETLYRAAPFGVGYHASVWYPAGAR